MEVSPVDRNGVYEATVSINNTVSGVPKIKSSTMFPDKWSADRVIAESQAAYLKGIDNISADGKWVGRSPSGVLIEGFIDTATGRIRTAYPLIAK